MRTNHPIRLTAAAALLSLGVAGPAHAQAPFGGGEAGSRGPVSEATRLPHADIGQERATRAVETPPSLRHPAPRDRTARAETGSQGAARAPEASRPPAQRTALPARPHATDPDMPKQATARSAPRDLRAPAPAADTRGGGTARATPETAASRAPRMTVAGNTRTTRASFEDWLFGR